MEEYVTISKKDLKALKTLVAEKDAYIQILELALDSVKRQLDNIQEAKDAEA